MQRKIIASGLTLVLFIATYAAVRTQDNQDRLAVGKGNGTLKLGDEKFKITSVVVKLMQDGKAEITLISDINIFLTASWSNHAASQQEFDLQITDSDSRGGIEGAGKVVLSNDGKMVAQLVLKGTSRATKRSVEANFEGK